MSDRASAFVGSIPTFYDEGLGPVFFAEFADDIARRVAAAAPARVLELAAGTGIVTRRLRGRLPVRPDVLPRQGPGLSRGAPRSGPGWAVYFQRLGLAPVQPDRRVDQC